MNKRGLVLLGLIFLLLFYIPQTRTFIINFANYLKMGIEDVSNSVTDYFKTLNSQREEIRQLRLKIKTLEEKNAYFQANFLDCQEFKKFHIIDDKNLTFVKTISYVAIPDFSAIFVNYSKKFDKPLGLVYNNLAAGVVIKNLGNFSKAILNINPKTTYSVFIGKEKVPGVFVGEEKVVKFIPKYKKINVGDLVITSGLDGIFYEGAFVGKVVEVKNYKLYQTAKIKTFFNDLNPKYFYVVRRH